MVDALDSGLLNQPSLTSLTNTLIVGCTLKKTFCKNGLQNNGPLQLIAFDHRTLSLCCTANPSSGVAYREFIDALDLELVPVLPSVRTTIKVCVQS